MLQNCPFGETCLHVMHSLCAAYFFTKTIAKHAAECRLHAESPSWTQLVLPKPSVNDDAHLLNNADKSLQRRRYSICMISRIQIVYQFSQFNISSHSYSNCHHLRVKSTLASKCALSVLGLNGPETTVQFPSPSD